jgi:GTP-binding protein HflX
VGTRVGGLAGGNPDEHLAELGHLVRSAGGTVVGSIFQELRRPDPATLIGRGKLSMLAALGEEATADLVVFDDDLSPAQQRNIERSLGRRVVDRSQVILDIFARRARTREGRLQVELAQLQYILPRLSGKGVLLSRLGGGIGTRGPGETKLETDRRRIRRRIQSIRDQIERVRCRRRIRREGRRRTDLPVVALVGYTSAGKSTLFNALAAADAPVSDQLFMTLDPLVRSATLGPGCETLIVDTVGFVRKLPHALVAAFRATLEEVVEADLMIHVIDASAKDLEEREGAVEKVLETIGAAGRPRVVVLNKADRIEPNRARSLAEARPGAILTSARRAEGLGELRTALSDALGLGTRRLRLRFRPDEGRAIASLYAAAQVKAHEILGEDVWIEAEVPARAAEQYRRRQS